MKRKRSHLERGGLVSWIVLLLLVALSTSTAASQIIDERFLPILNDYNLMMNEIEGQYTQSLPITALSIVDLVDVSNRYPSQSGENTSVLYIPGHIYHVAFFELTSAYSNIYIAGEDFFLAFRALNCSEYGDSIEDVFEALATQDSTLISRISSYRRYGYYHLTDPQVVEFNC